MILTSGIDLRRRSLPPIFKGLRKEQVVERVRYATSKNNSEGSFRSFFQKYERESSILLKFILSNEEKNIILIRVSILNAFSE